MLDVRIQLGTISNSCTRSALDDAIFSKRSLHPGGLYKALPNHLSAAETSFFTSVCIPEGPSTQYLRLLVPKAILFVAFGL